MAHAGRDVHGLGDQPVIALTAAEKATIAHRKAVKAGWKQFKADHPDEKLPAGRTRRDPACGPIHSKLNFHTTKARHKVRRYK